MPATTKATLRKNGLVMLPFTVRFNIGRDDLIKVVRDAILESWAPKASRAKIIALARKAARAYGMSWSAYEVTDEDVGVDEDVWDAAWNTAIKLVDKAFPEMKQ